VTNQKNKPTEIKDKDLDDVHGGLLDYDWIAKSKQGVGPKTGGKKDPNSFTAPGDVAGVKN